MKIEHNSLGRGRVISEVTGKEFHFRHPYPTICGRSEADAIKLCEEHEAGVQARIDHARSQGVELTQEQILNLK